MTVTYPIVAPAEGEVISPEWCADVTEAVNTAAAAVPVQGLDGSVTDGSTTSTSFTNSLTTTGVQGAAFVANTSGRALVFFSATGRNGTSGQAVALDCEVREGSTVGSGTVVRSSSDVTNAVQQNASAGQNTGLSGFVLVTGLTANATYNAAMTYKAVTSGTATYNRRSLIVINIQ